MVSSDADGRAPELKVLHEADRHFQNKLDYKTYRFPDMSQTNNGQMAGDTGKYAKRMETLRR